VGQTSTLSASVRDGAGATLSGRVVTWNSDAPNVATVANGLVTAVSPGTATIAASADGRSGTSTITVIPIPVSRLVLSESAASLVVGATLTMTAQTLSSGGAVLTGRPVTWSSTTPTAATVSNGIVTAIAVGTTSIIASSEGRADTAIMTVTPVPVATVTLSSTTGSVVVGVSTTLTATTRDAAGALLTGRAIAWSTSSATIATVTNGVVTGVATGVATITATSEGQNATAQITVTPVPVASVTILPATVSVSVGQTSTLTATPRDGGGAALAGRAVTWSTSSAAIATVANGVVTGVAPGSATITATSEGRSGTATVTVTALVATWTATTELQIGLDPRITLQNEAIAADGRAISATGTNVYERSASGSWNFTPYSVPGSPAVVDVHVDPTGVFWVTGSNGVIVRRAVGGWEVENTTTNAAAFNSISINADQSGFAVGNPGNTIYHRSSVGVWTTRAIVNSTILNWVGSANANFAVTTGRSISGSTGAAFMWNGTTWSTVTFPVANFIASTGVVISPTEVYLAGTTGTDVLSNYRYTVMRWDGVTWSVFFQKPVEVYAASGNIARCGDGSVYFGSQWGPVYRLQGGTLVPLAGAPPYAYFANVYCESDNSLWISRGFPDNLLMRFSGGIWSEQRWWPSMQSVDISDAGVAYATNGYTVGRRANGTWTHTDIPHLPQTPVLLPMAVAALGTRAVVSGFPSGLFDGSSWQWSAGLQTGAKGVVAPNATTAFAVGASGVINTLNGTTWNNVPIPGGGPSSLDVIRAVGTFALAASRSSSSPGVQWNAGTWSLFPSAPPAGWRLYEVFGPSSVVSLTNNTLYEWNGTAWNALPGGNVSGSVLALVARAPNDIYLFRSNDIAYYDGASVRVIQTGISAINAVARRGNDAIAVGDNGYVLRATLPSANQSVRKGP
jgi:uncharacterized protein YjdB